MQLLYNSAVICYASLEPFKVAIPLEAPKRLVLYHSLSKEAQYDRKKISQQKQRIQQL